MATPPAPAGPPPPSAYPPSPGYAPAGSAPSSGGVKLPAGMTLWDLVGVLIILVGAILILVGFLYGDGFASNTGAGGSASTAQNDLEAFFVATGIGVFLTILGWLFRFMMPMFLGRKSTTAASAPSPTMMAAPTPVTPVAPPPTAPAPPPAAPASPACSNCGKPTTYIAQYGRYYCYSCSRYV